MIMEDLLSDAVDSGNQSNISQNSFAEHDQAPSENLDSFRHFDIAPAEELPFNSLGEIGRGRQAWVDKVEYERCICVRKQWNISEVSQKERAEKRFWTEVEVLKKLRGECHVVRLLATYRKGTELGLLHLPLGQCDLKVLLSKPTQERRGLISDDDLERGLACLSAALQYMHQIRIRHKDIKPDNILIYGANLVFIDFGISRDFSELTFSLTDDDAVGTYSYYAPEVVGDRPRGCAADVFSLACVLLEILSVLFGLAPEDQDSFTSLKPYHRHLTKVQDWIQEKKSLGNSPLRAFWLQACQFMVAKSPKKRPRMTNVLLRLREEYEGQPSTFSTMCCGVCLEKRILQSTEGKQDELRNTDFTWGSDVRTLLDQDHLTSLLPNSNQDRKTVILKRLASPLRQLGIVQRWYLRIYLDNGRPLISYGTRSVSVNYTFDFGESLIDRVEFEEGTFGKTVELYKKSNWEGHCCFRSRAPCNQTFDEPMCIRSYKIIWD